MANDSSMLNIDMVDQFGRVSSSVFQFLVSKTM